MEYEMLEDLFFDYFPNWEHKVASIEQNSPSEIRVDMKDGSSYLFGRNDGEVYLKTLKKSQE